jgi:uracil-DNA glycosylase
MCELLAQAGISRRDTLLWNVVPWYVGQVHRIAPASDADVREGCRWLARLLVLLTRLNVVVLVGKAAQAARPALAESKLEIVETCHPSNRVFNRWPERRAITLHQFERVAKILREV